MQQFARRPEPEGAPEPSVSNETLAQLLDQLSGLARQVAEMREEIAAMKATPKVEAVETSVEPPVVEPERETSVGNVLVDEEEFIEIARTSPATTESPVMENALSDDEIQRLLTDAALGAVSEEPEPVELEEPVLRVVEDEPALGAILLDRSLVARVPSHLAIAALAVPHRMEGTSLVVKAALPFDTASLDVIADSIACPVVPEAAPMEDVLAALRAAYGTESREVERDTAFAVADAPKKRGLFRRSA